MKYWKGIAVTVIAVGAVVASVFMFTSPTSAQPQGQWADTWTAQFDIDHRTYYVDLDPNPQERYLCGNVYHSGCFQGNLANNEIFTAPATVVGWNHVGSVNIGGSITGYQETWIPGDGLGPETDYAFNQDGFSGSTTNRDHSWGFFTGEGRLVDAGAGAKRLMYKFIFASNENGSLFPAQCRSEAYFPSACSYWLNWGDLPASSTSIPPTTTSLSNDDFSGHLRIFTRMNPGMPTKWTVTGEIL